MGNYINTPVPDAIGKSKSKRRVGLIFGTPKQYYIRSKPYEIAAKLGFCPYQGSNLITKSMLYAIIMRVCGKIVKELHNTLVLIIGVFSVETLSKGDFGYMHRLIWFVLQTSLCVRVGVCSKPRPYYSFKYQSTPIGKINTHSRSYRFPQ